MKYVLRLILLCFLASLCSCGSHKKVSKGFTSEDYIVYEMEGLLLPSGTCEQALVATALEWKGTPYEYGGHSKKGTDCSGFVKEVYKDAMGIDLPRNSAKQADDTKKVKKEKLKVGDLVFFRSNNKNKISHVGIYLGGGKFIHASSSKGVMISRLDTPYFDKNFKRGGRVKEFERMQRKEKRRK